MILGENVTRVYRDRSNIHTLEEEVYSDIDFERLIELANTSSK